MKWILLPLLVAALAGCLTPSDSATLLVTGLDGTTQATLSFHQDEAPSATYYLDHGLAHPGLYTAFDLTVQWAEAAGVVADFGYFDGLGFYLSTLDGAPEDPSSAYWSLEVDGAPSEVGMEQVPVTDGMQVAWVLTPLDAFVSDPVVLTVDPLPAETRDADLTVTGSVDREAQVTVTLSTYIDDVGEGPGLVDGAWNKTLALHPGANTVVVRADDGQSVVQTFNVTRLVGATFEVHYGGFAPGQGDSSDDVWFDPSTYPSQAMYDEQGVSHPPYANIHDLMEAWVAQTGSTIDYTYTESLQGFSVTKIDGAGNPLSSGAPPWWCYSVNGENPGAGISVQGLEPGSTVAWTLGDCDIAG